MADNSRVEWTKLALATIGGTIVFGTGLVQYVTTSSLSVRQPFLEKQTEMRLKASEYAARLATTTEEEQWHKSWEEFWMLYWGPLAVVEEAGTKSKVADAMQKFGDMLKLLNKAPDDHSDAAGAKPMQPYAEKVYQYKHSVNTGEQAVSSEQLAGLAIDIAHECSALLHSKWRTGILDWSGRQ